MSFHRYILRPYRGPASRIACPSCGHKREFAQYMDSQSGEVLADHVGRCNREGNCGYHFTPKEYFAEKGLENEFSYTIKKENFPTRISKNLIKPEIRESINAVQNRTKPDIPDTLPLDLVNQTMRNHDQNNLVVYLRSLFGEATTNDLIARYLIGTSKHWKGATVFWQIDEREQVRQCKIMLYHPQTGRRVRSDEPALKWSGGELMPDQGNGDKIFFAGKRLLGDYDANLQQCLFGQHLLTEHPKSKVAVVESEKTALIASVYFPRLIWLATGGKNGARWTDGQGKALQGREVVLFPDLGQYEAWKTKAKELTQNVSCNAMVSDILETVATDTQRSKGWDLADYLVTKDEAFGWALSQYGYPAFWDYQPSA